MISKDAQKALDDLGDYSVFAGASHDEVEAGIADEAKEWLIAYIASLESELASRDALIERLVEAGDKVAHYSNFEDFDINGIDEWDALVAEWQAMKRESVE